MSAIFGAIGTVSRNELDEMGKRLAHRGPIVQWEEVTSQVYLGCNRSAYGTVVKSNGYAAVVDLTAAASARVSEQSVVEAFVHEGISGIGRLQAAVALALWDERTQSLVLARDFVGHKPLHYCPLPGGGIAFATEYKALLAIERIPVIPDYDALQYLQCFKRTPQGRTLLENIYPAPPGGAIRLDRSGVLKSRDDILPLQVNVQPLSEDTARDELARRFVKAISPSVAGRDRVGLSLSGGIDSVSVAFVTRQCAPQAELVGITAGNGPNDPEIRNASLVMERLGGTHIPVIVTPEPLMNLLPMAVWHFESPVGRTETVQALEIGRAARAAGFDWLMSGMGSDNLFAGMPKHKLLWMTQLLPPLRRDLQEFYTLTQSGRRPQRPLARLMDAVYFRGAVPNVPHIRQAHFEPEIVSFPPPGPEFLNHALAAGANDNISRSLVRLERPFQAFGVDFVSPFFDRDIMDYAFMLPSRLKIRRGREKYILRQAMRSLVSPDLLNVPKGISRIAHDATFAETLRQLAARYLSKDRVLERGLFEYADVEHVQRHLRRSSYHTEAAMRLWTMIVTEIWAEIYLDNRGRRPTGN